MSIDLNRGININRDNVMYTFGRENLRKSKKSTSKPAKPCIDTEEKYCRICLDNNTNLEFIRPCKCSGSVKYVHEDCLKTWLISLGKDLEPSICEICNTKYLMKIVVKKECSPGRACNNSAAHCFFIPILITVMVMLFLIVYLLSLKYFESGASNNQKAYTMALSLTCLIAGLVIIALVTHSIKEACLVPKLHEWKILSQNIQMEEERDMNKEDLEKMDEIRSLKLPVPSQLRVNGKRVRIPKFSSFLSPKYSELKDASVSSLSPVNAGGSVRELESLNENYYDSQLRRSSSGLINSKIK